MGTVIKGPFLGEIADDLRAVSRPPLKLQKGVLMNREGSFNKRK